MNVCLQRCWTWGAILGLALASASVCAQTADLPRLSFEEAEAGSTPRLMPQVEFSPLTPREPPRITSESAAKVQPTRLEPEAKATRLDPEVKPAGCSSCGGGGGLMGLGDCSICGHGPRPGCAPGQRPFCESCADAHGHIGRFFVGVYECLCCPDPCYEGRWRALADTAFHVASPRPVNHQRIRWNAGLNVILADRAEFFWARQDGMGKGPSPSGGALVASDRIRYHELVHYLEAGTGTVAAVVETPYRSMDPDGAPHAAGFGDIKVGVKTLLFDCELLQVGTQFLTYTPAGVPSKGLGVGHVSLEPSLLVGVKVGPNTYFQTQISEWIPLGGDLDYAGAVLHTHSSLNQVLYRCPGVDVTLIGAAEFSSWSFQDGAYTDPVFGSYRKAGDYTYMSVGGGARLFICDRVDFGINALFSVNSQHLPAQLYVTEFRFRY